MSLPPEFKTKHFLVTDDYESMRIMMADHLKQLGVEKILFASSGNEAFELVKNNAGGPQQIDFLLTDMVMENGSGIDLVKNLRADARFKKLPALMVTSKSEVALVLEAAKAGVSGYIVKPWKIEDLEKKILECVAKSKA